MERNAGSRVKEPPNGTSARTAVRDGEAPAIDVKWGGQVAASQKLPLTQLATAS